MRFAFLKWRLKMLYIHLLKATGTTRHGFFIPYEYSHEVNLQTPPYPAVSALFSAQSDQFRDVIAEVGQHVERLAAIGDRQQDPKWDSSFFPPRDGAVAYALTAKVGPRRIMEIGSGNSTRFMVAALKDNGVDCSVTCIDPAPRSALEELPVNHIQRVLREDDVSLAESLEKNDILFIDSSHIMLPGTDVDIQFNRIFPALRAGVIVHIHDIFLPYSYPSLARRFLYSEQNSLIGWILSGYFEVIFSGHYASRRHQDAWRNIASKFPPLMTPNAGSLWLRKR